MNLVLLVGKEQGKKNNLSKQLKGIKSDLATLQRTKDKTREHEVCLQARDYSGSKLH